MKLNGKKIAIIIASANFRDEEFQIPYEIFKKAGAEIKIGCSSLNTSVGRFGLKVKPEILLGEIKATDFDCIMFVGGPGVKEYWQNLTAHRVAKDFYQIGKLTTAICSAPVIFAKAGLLKSKRCTSFDGDEQELVRAGGIYTGRKVEKDGIIITGNGPAAAKEFAEKIVESL